MSHDSPIEHAPPPSGPFAWYQRTPLYIRILIALVLGIIAGYALGHKAEMFKPFSAVVLRLLGALATPLIFIAVVQAITKAKVEGKTAAKLLGLLFMNTVVAILIGLAVANIIKPGSHVHIEMKTETVNAKPFDPIEDLLGKIPGSVLKPLAENDIMSVILIALALGISLRTVRSRGRESTKATITVIENLLDVGFKVVMVILHWVIALVPLAVFGVVAQKVGTQGIATFQPLLWFILAVMLALALQACYYLARIYFGSWVKPLRFLHGGSEAILTAFSTASSAATLPITFNCMRQKIGVREESASLGVMVGGAFNHDGTALYEAMAALFISQILQHQLGFGQQLLVVFMAVMASVGAAGIPEAGLVTMMAVFNAVRLPIEYIPMLLVVDWFLDRCRTAINVMGDMSVTCLLDGMHQAKPDINVPVDNTVAVVEAT